MDINVIIDELQEYCIENKDTNTLKKEMIDDYQIEFLSGYIEISINKYIMSNEFEVYLNIKTTDKIACPLLYQKFDNTTEAKQYYEKLKNLINNNDEKYIINCCKIRL